MSQLPPRRRRVLFMILTGLMFMLGLEGVARLWLYFNHPDRQELVEASDPRLGFRNNPGLPGGEISSLGTRGPEPDLSRRIRVLVIGDSISFGVHLESRETYPMQLERLLGPDTAILNAGTTGYNTWQERANLQRLAPLVDPTVVVIQFCPNDRYKGQKSVLLWASGQERRRQHFAGDRLESTLYRYSGLAHAAYLLRARRDTRTWQEQMQASPPPLDWPGEWREEFEGLLEDAQALAPRVIVLLTPLREQLTQDLESSDEEAHRLAREAGVEVVDVLAAFSAEAGAQAGLHLYQPDDPVHLSVRGSEIVAQELAKVLGSEVSDPGNARQLMGRATRPGRWREGS